MDQDCGYDDGGGAHGVGEDVEEDAAHVFVVVVVVGMRVCRGLGWSCWDKRGEWGVGVVVVRVGMIMVVVVMGVWLLGVGVRMSMAMIVTMRMSSVVVSMVVVAEAGHPNEVHSESQCTYNE